MHRLTAARVKSAKPGEKLSDGGGLRLDVDRNGNAAWLFRFTSPSTGRERFMGLGSARDVTLAQAREGAQEARGLIQRHTDPIDHRLAMRAAARADASRATTFRQYAEQFIGGREAGWKNPKHRQQWRTSLAAYVYPHIGSRAVAEIDAPEVLSVLRPIWTTKPETARRIRGRIELILSAAKVEGLRTGANPALWRGHLDQVLAGRKKSSVKHHDALPYAELPQFMASLASDTSAGARLLSFIVLTASRYSEAAGMSPDEVSGDVWTIPASRLKAGRPHIVPLTEAALGLLPVPNVSDTTLRNIIKRHTDTPATTHGFRSAFRDWAGDESSFPRELIELALAHEVGSETEAAYRRGTALTKRRQLMEAWAKFALSRCRND